VDQRGERVHVVALERVDVADQERALAFVEGTAWVRRADVAGIERRPRALEGAVDRGDAGIEQLGDLGPTGRSARHAVNARRCSSRSSNAGVRV